jgi:hypothetical protein
MTQTPMAQGKLFAQLLDPANRANPYPLYARQRQTPVALQEDGTYVVSTYREIVALLHDPRIRSLDADHPHRASSHRRDARALRPSFFSTHPITTGCIAW